MVIIKKSQHKSPVTEGGARSSIITQYYVNADRVLWRRFVSFFTRTEARKLGTKNKKKAAEHFLSQPMTLRSLGDWMGRKKY